MKRTAHRHRSAAGVAACVWVLFVGASASAQRVVVSDIVGTGDEPAAITLLLRSMLQQGPRVAVPLADLRRGLEKVPTARALGAANAVDYTQSPPLMKELLADRLITGDVLRDDRLSLSLRVTDKEGHILAATTLQTVRGDVSGLAYEAAKRVAKDGGFEVTQVQASLGELRPFARASQQVGRNNSVAARALDVADPAVVSRVPAVREAADLLKADEKLPLDKRMSVAMAAGETQEAIKMGSAPGASPEARAELARAEIAAGDPNSAEKILAEMKTEHSANAELARAELALKKGKTGDAGKIFTELLQKSPPDAKALASVSRTPANLMDKNTMNNAIQAARRMSQTMPGVASAVGMKGARGGSKEAVAMLNGEELSATEARELGELLDQDLSGANKTLAAQVKDRNGATVIEVSEGDRKKANVVGAKKAAVVKPPRTVAPEVRAVAQQLTKFLEAFDPLAAHEPGTLDLHPAQEGQPAWSPFAVNRQLLGLGVAVALAEAPYNLGVVEKTEPLSMEISLEEAAKLAPEDGYLMIYRLTADGMDGHVWLRLYDTKTKQLLEFDEKLPGDLKLVKLNPFLGPIAGVLLLALIIWLSLRMFVVGEIAVEIKKDPGAENQAFVLLVSKKAKVKAFKDVSKFHRAGQGPSRRRGRRYVNPPIKSEFPRVPVGTWYVHLYGTYEKGGEVRVLPDGICEKITVTRNGSVAIKLDTDPNACEFRVRVIEKTPIVGALVFLDGKKELGLRTDAQGGAVVIVPSGAHTIHVHANDLVIEKKISSTGSKVQNLLVDLEHERKMAKLAKGLELSTDESDDWRAPAPPRSDGSAEEPAPGSQPLGSLGDPVQADEDGDYISMPAMPPMPAKPPAPPPGAVALQPDDGIDLPDVGDKSRPAGPRQGRT